MLEKVWELWLKENQRNLRVRHNDRRGNQFFLVPLTANIIYDLEQIALDQFGGEDPEANAQVEAAWAANRRFLETLQRGTGGAILQVKRNGFMRVAYHPTHRELKEAWIAMLKADQPEMVASDLIRHLDTICEMLAEKKGLARGMGPKWAKAEKAVLSKAGPKGYKEPKVLAQYDQPGAVVAHVFRKMGGRYRGESLRSPFLGGSLMEVEKITFAPGDQVEFLEAGRWTRGTFVKYDSEGPWRHKPQAVLKTTHYGDLHVSVDEVYPKGKRPAQIQ